MKSCLIGKNLSVEIETLSHSVYEPITMNVGFRSIIPQFYGKSAVKRGNVVTFKPTGYGLQTLHII